MTAPTMDDTVNHSRTIETPSDDARTARGAPITIGGVHKVFRRRRQVVEALRAVDLEIRGGELISLLGPSGCGKSTLLRVVGGLIAPDAGQIDVGGRTPVEARQARQFGLVPQSPALVPWTTVERTVRFLSTLDSSGRRNGTALPDTEIDELIESVGLAKFRRAYPHELSGGMQQRVSLVRGFALGAPVLLMDEPFAALDEITRSEMRFLLLDLWQRTGTTVVFVTHSITEAVILSDRVVVMAARPGRIGAIEEISLDRPRTPEMEDGPTFHEHVRVLRDHLRDHHA
jgi:NitT/TauT family transport system ATP-binding protein